MLSLHDKNLPQLALRVALLALVAPIALTPIAVASEEAIVFRLHPKDTETHPFLVTQSQTTTINLGALGSQNLSGEIAFEGHFKATPLTEGTFEMETTYDRFTMTTEQMGQKTVIDSSQPGEQPEAQALGQMIGHPVKVQFNEIGKVLSVEGFSDLLKGSLAAAGPEAAGSEAAGPEATGMANTLEQAFSDDSMIAMMQQSQAIYPEHAVRPGESWTAKFDLSNPALGEMGISTNYTFIELGKSKGRDAARLDLVMDLTFSGDLPLLEQMNAMFAQQGGSLDMTIGDSQATGTLWIDLANGMTLDATLDQAIDIAMNLNIAGQEMAMNMEMESVTRSQFYDIDE